MLIESILGALLPIAAEGGKQLITRLVGGVRPTSIAEQIQLDQSEVARIEALAKLDAPIGNPSQWVIDLRSSARYVGALIVIGVGISTLYIPVDNVIRTIALEAANIAFGFLFGARIVNGWQKK